MQLRDIFRLSCFQGTRIVGEDRNLDRPIAWVHVVDLPDPRPWVKKDQLILSTGYALGGSPAEQRAFIRRLDDAGACGLALAVPQRFERMPDAMVTEARSRGIPLFEVPWEVPFAEITEEVHRALILEQNRLIERSEEVHRILTRTAVTYRSLNDLVATLGEVLDRSVVIEDTAGTLLASFMTGGVADAAPLESLASGRATSHDRTHLGAVELEASFSEGSNTIRVAGTDDGSIAARIACRIRLLDEHIGFIWIIEGREPLTDLDIRAAEHAAVLAALHIAHQRELLVLENKVGSSFVDAILEGRFEPTPSALERARLWGFSIDAPYLLVMAMLPEGPPLSETGLLVRERAASDVRGRLQRMDLPVLVTQNLDRIFFLVPPEFALSQLSDLVSHYDLRVVVSDPVVGPTEIRGAHGRLQRVERHLASGTIHHFRDFLVPRVLHGDGEAHQDLMEAIIVPLLGAGKGTSLVDTLQALARTNFVLSRAAVALAIHPSTLRYRVERIEDVLGMALGDPDVRFMAQMACYLSYESTEKRNALPSSS